MEKIAIDLGYAENINSGLTRFSKNILNLIKEKSLTIMIFYNHPPKKSAKHLTEFTNLKIILYFIIGQQEETGDGSLVFTI